MAMMWDILQLFVELQAEAEPGPHSSHRLSHPCTQWDTRQHISHAAPPIVAIHELSGSSLVALSSLAATNQSGLRVHRLSHPCTQWDIRQHISHAAPPTVAIHELSGSSLVALSPLAATNQSGLYAETGQGGHTQPTLLGG